MAQVLDFQPHQLRPLEARLLQQLAGAASAEGLLQDGADRAEVLLALATHVLFPEYGEGKAARLAEGGVCARRCRGGIDGEVCTRGKPKGVGPASESRLLAANRSRPHDLIQQPTTGSPHGGRPCLEETSRKKFQPLESGQSSQVEEACKGTTLSPASVFGTSCRYPESRSLNA
uniref:Uncharacterized protein n=1 Tax=Micrurus spixii TaxID=129469 RepID=A0A2D4NAD1_9SAUR